jgi:hypothetical protein
VRALAVMQLAVDSVGVGATLTFPPGHESAAGVLPPTGPARLAWLLRPGSVRGERTVIPRS